MKKKKATTTTTAKATSGQVKRLLKAWETIVNTTIPKKLDVEGAIRTLELIREARTNPTPEAMKDAIAALIKQTSKQTSTEKGF